MKKIKQWMVLMLALVTLCCAGVTAYAETLPEIGIISISDAISSKDAEEASSEMEPLPEVRELIPGTPKPAAGQENPTDTPQAPTRGSNTPYFVGAGIAVIVFIGVAAFCKFKGNR